MKRRLAFAIAFAMVFASVPANVLTGFAEEDMIIEEAMDEGIFEEDIAAENTAAEPVDDAVELEDAEIPETPEISEVSGQTVDQTVETAEELSQNAPDAFIDEIEVIESVSAPSEAMTTNEINWTTLVQGTNYIPSTSQELYLKNTYNYATRLLIKQPLNQSGFNIELYYYNSEDREVGSVQHPETTLNDGSKVFVLAGNTCYQLIISGATEQREIECFYTTLHNSKTEIKIKAGESAILEPVTPDDSTLKYEWYQILGNLQEQSVGYTERVYTVSGLTKTGDYCCHITDGNGITVEQKFCISVDAEACVHEMTCTSRVEPTCSTDGFIKMSCTKCDYTEESVLPATGNHTMAVKIDKAATCGAAGSQHMECSVCGHKEASTAIPATNQHTFGAWTTTQAPTVFAQGVSARACSVCGKQETAPIAKLAPTMTVNATKLPLKIKQSTTKVTVSGLAAGDYVASWKSSNTKIVKVNSKGKITAQSKAGKANITITLASGLKKTVKVTVQKGAVKTSKIKNVNKKLTLAKGKTAKLAPVIEPVTTTDKVSYSTSNKKVATVSKKGVIKATGSGKAKITVKSGSKKVTVTVTVPKTAPTGITGVKAALTLKKGKSTTLKPKLSPKGAEAKITFKSSNKKVATVDAKGKIVAKKKGKAVITVKAGKVSKTCTVTVK